jgi:hypothetical protein
MKNDDGHDKKQKSTRHFTSYFSENSHGLDESRADMVASMANFACRNPQIATGVVYPHLLFVYPVMLEVIFLYTVIFLY